MYLSYLFIIWLFVCFILGLDHICLWRFQRGKATSLSCPVARKLSLHSTWSCWGLWSLRNLHFPADGRASTAQGKIRKAGTWQMQDGESWKSCKQNQNSSGAGGRAGNANPVELAKEMLPGGGFQPSSSWVELNSLLWAPHGEASHQPCPPNQPVWFAAVESNK